MISSNITQAVKILRQGGIVVYPTDTAFGIGCRVDSTQSVEKLFSIRKRPVNQAVPVLVNSIAMAKKYFLSPLPQNVRHLMEIYWPSALTIVYKCREELIPSLVRGGGKTIGFRMPKHEVPLELIKQLNVPILGPSANFHGFPTPYLYDKLDPDLLKLVDYIIPGECNAGNVSTVIDCTLKPWKIIRLGAVEIKIDKLTL